MDEQQGQPVASMPVAATESAQTPVVPSEPQKKSKMPIIVGVIVLVLAGLGFWAYQVYASPGRVWQKFISTPIN